MDSEDDENILNIMEDLDEKTFTNDPTLNTSISSPPPPTSTLSSTELCEGAKLDLQPGQEFLDCLKSNFGHARFRSIQWEVVKSIIIDRQDNCVIMATGYGKSLCFQYPSVFLNSLTIVISPLISLMEDQVLNLNVANIPACLLGTAQKNPNIRMEIQRGKYRIVYMSPEYLVSNYNFLKELEDMLSLIAIDEAHCVSQWGHDFRPCYRQLGEIRNRIQSVPILAVTATATKRVRDDICSVLQLCRPQVLCTGFDRPNLNFTVYQQTTPWPDLRPFLTNQMIEGGSIIIYCLTRQCSMDIMEMLQKNNINCEAYHAGLELKKRSEILENFVHDRLQVIVATVAFGMGIDKPDVRLVIHYGASRDIESYYQEVGRAGRDGRPAKCILFYSRKDFAFHRALRFRSNKHLSERLNKHLDELARAMQNYIFTLGCRRLQILQYFEGENNVICLPRSDCCDNCRRPKSIPNLYVGMDEQGDYDFGDDATILLQGIDVFMGHTGLTKPLALIRGSRIQSINQYQKNLLFGRGKHKSDDYWKSLFQLLRHENFIIEKTVTHTTTSFPYQVIKLTMKAHNWLNDKLVVRKLLLKPNQEILKYMKKKYVPPLYDTTISTIESVDNSSTSKLLTLNPGNIQKSKSEDLLQKSLYVCRASLASQYSVMPYMIASNLALEQLAAIKPLNLNELTEAKIDGFSEIKISKFGPEIIKCIMENLKLLPSSSKQINSGCDNMVSILQENPIQNNKVPTQRIDEILELINKNLNINEIAMNLFLNESTVAQYICQLIKAGYEITKLHLNKLANITVPLFEQINNKIPTDDSIMTIFLRTIKEQLPETIDWNQIKLVLSYQQVRYHLNKLQIKYVDPDKIPIVSSNVDDDNNSENIDQNNDANIFKEDPTAILSDLNDLNDLNELLDDSDELFAELENEKFDKYFDCSNETVFNENIDNELAVQTTVDTTKPSNNECSQTSVNLWEDENDDLFVSMPLNENFTSSPSVIQSNSSNSNNNTQMTIPKKSQFLKRSPINNRIQYCNSSSDDDDDDDDGNKKIKNISKQTPRKRVLPNWMRKDTGKSDNNLTKYSKFRKNLF